MLTCGRVVVMTTFLLAIFAGCGDDDKGTNGNGNGIPSQLVGTWTFPEEVTVIVNGVPMSVKSKDVLDWEPNSVSARITIDDNGSFTYEELDSEGTVVYDTTVTVSVSGDTITVTLIKLPINSAIWSVNGNQLTLTVDVIGYTYVIILTREPSGSGMRVEQPDKRNVNLYRRVKRT